MQFFCNAKRPNIYCPTGGNAMRLCRSWIFTDIIEKAESRKFAEDKKTIVCISIHMPCLPSESCGSPHSFRRPKRRYRTRKVQLSFARTSLIS